MITETDLMRELHAEYMAAERQPGEFTTAEWAEQYWEGNTKRAYGELEYLVNIKKMTKREKCRDDEGRPCNFYKTA